MTRRGARRKNGGSKKAELWSIWPPVIIDSEQSRKKMKEKMRRNMREKMKEKVNEKMKDMLRRIKLWSLFNTTYHYRVRVCIFNSSEEF